MRQYEVEYADDGTISFKLSPQVTLSFNAEKSTDIFTVEIRQVGGAVDKIGVEVIDLECFTTDISNAVWSKEYHERKG